MTPGRSASSAWRSSNANSRRPGTTGKYVKRPLRRLPGSGIGWSISSGIPQRFLPEYFHDGGFECFVVVGLLRGQALQLDGEAGYVDAVAHGVALVGCMRHLQ